MNPIRTVKCCLCEKDIKVGIISKKGGAIVENHPFYDIYLVHEDLSDKFFEEFHRSICKRCFEKLLNKSIIKENEELKMQNQELLKEKYQLTHDLYEAYIKINKLTGEENQNEPKSNN